MAKKLSIKGKDATVRKKNSSQTQSEKKKSASAWIRKEYGDVLKELSKE